MTIYITGLEDMPKAVRAYGVRHLISILQNEFQPPTPAGIDANRHHRCVIHDIVLPSPGETLADVRHMRELIAFLTSWDGESPLLVHCMAGVSRSTAVALIAHAMRSGDPAASAAALRLAAPYAWPNTRLVELADELLDLDSALVLARASMGAATAAKVPGQVAMLSVPK